MFGCVYVDLCVRAIAWRRHCGERPVGARRTGGKRQIHIHIYTYFGVDNCSVGVYSFAPPGWEGFGLTRWGSSFSALLLFFLLSKSKSSPEASGVKPSPWKPPIQGWFPRAGMRRRPCSHLFPCTPPSGASRSRGLNIWARW